MSYGRTHKQTAAYRANIVFAKCIGDLKEIILKIERNIKQTKDYRNMKYKKAAKGRIK